MYSQYQLLDLCVVIIVRIVVQVRGMLADIATLESACHTATDRLSSLQRGHAAPPAPAEETILRGHIHEIQKEKAILTTNLPTLIRFVSSM